MCECAVFEFFVFRLCLLVLSFVHFLIFFYIFWLATHSEQFERASERANEQFGTLFFFGNIFYELVHCSSTQNIKVKKRT